MVDGFHRLRVGSAKGALRQRLHGYLPIAAIRAGREGDSERIAATIRHNRARGVHGVLPMTAIVVTLLKAGWSRADVARELGMDNDEVLRFKQVSGLPSCSANTCIPAPGSSGRRRRPHRSPRLRPRRWSS